MNGLENLDVREVDRGAVISVKVVAGSSRSRIAGVLGDCLKITTSAAAEKGKANAAVAAALADALGVDKRSVELVSGPMSPRKQFRAAGMTAAEVRRRLKAM